MGICPTTFDGDGRNDLRLALLFLEIYRFRYENKLSVVVLDLYIYI